MKITEVKYTIHSRPDGSRNVSCANDRIIKEIQGYVSSPLWMVGLPLFIREVGITITAVQYMKPTWNKETIE